MEITERRGWGGAAAGESIYQKRREAEATEVSQEREKSEVGKLNPHLDEQGSSCCKL